MGADRASYAGGQAFGVGRATPRLRDVVDAILYYRADRLSVAGGGMLPKDFPPFTTVARFISTIGEDNGLFEKINVRVAAADAGKRRAVMSEPICRGHRQSIGQDHRERWTARLRRGQEGQGP